MNVLIFGNLFYEKVNLTMLLNCIYYVSKYSLQRKRISNRVQRKLNLVDFCTIHPKECSKEIIQIGLLRLLLSCLH